LGKPQPTIPDRLVKIDRLTAIEHAHLLVSDDCYYLWEWDGAPYDLSATTNFIGNFQRHPRFKDMPDKPWPWRFKQYAIQHAADAIGRTMLPEWKKSIFVPVPPSRIKGDPGHDSRLMDTLRLADNGALKCHEIVLQLTNTQSREKGVSPAARARNWRLSFSSLKKCPEHIVVFDDLLTGGSHFSAMKIALARKLPDVPVSGLFLARRILTSSATDPSE
jgi:hypothetical protein